jgi:5'-3' exonuclease
MLNTFSTINKRRQILIIDTASIIGQRRFRPDLEENYDKYVKDVVNIIKHNMKGVKPTWTFFVTECGRENNYRLGIFPEYKKRRRVKTQAQINFSTSVFEEIKKLNCCSVVYSKILEGDDMICSTIKKYRKPNDNYMVVTNDSDMLQLLNIKHVKVILMDQNKKNQTLFDKAKFEEVYGFDSSYFTMYKALKGDATDGYKGIAGINSKLIIQELQKRSLPANIRGLEKLIHDPYFKSRSRIFYKTLTDFLDTNREDFYRNLDLARFGTDTNMVIIPNESVAG